MNIPSDTWKHRAIDPSAHDIQEGETMVAICDLTVPSYEQAFVFRHEQCKQLEWMFREHLISTTNLFSMLDVIKSGEKLIMLNDDVHVKIILKNYVLYLVEKSPVKISVPHRLKIGLQESTGHQCRIWAHRIFRYFYGGKVVRL